MTLTGIDLENFLTALACHEVEAVTIHHCGTIMPTRLVDEHERIGCPGKSSRWDTIMALMEEAENA